MEKISNKVFGGERPLFEIHNVELDHVRITFGESGVKECSNIVCRNCYFEGKYPLWHVKGSDIRNCYFAPGSRSAIWYSDDMHMEDCVINGPKFFRECDRAFEYSTVQADIRGHIKSVKNPASGRIVADSIGEIILDENIKKPADCEILTRA